jgi:hypothetical protein
MTMNERRSLRRAHLQIAQRAAIMQFEGVAQGREVVW